MAYILGDILELEHGEASNALSISKDNFRKQLSRARAKVIQFTKESCGLVSSCSKCSCDKKLAGAIKRQRVNPDKIQFAKKSAYNYIEIKEILQETHHELRTLVLQKEIAHYKCPNELSAIIESLVDKGIEDNKALRRTSW
jgi:hypothetical protein